MNGSSRTYVGVAINRQSRRFTFAALDYDKKLLSLNQGSLEEAAAYIAHLEKVWVGVNAPSELSQGLISEEQIAQKQPSLFPGRAAQLRRVEYDLLSRGVAVTRTPGAGHRCPRWIRDGLAFYLQLGRSGLSRYLDEDCERQWVETNADVIFHALRVGTLFESGTLEGRLQRQLLLLEAGVDVPDSMDFFEEVTRHRLLRGILPFDKICGQVELEAIASAYLCWLAENRPESVTLLGALDEGQMLVPIIDEK